MSKEFPVTVTLATGAKVRIGTAVTTEEGFDLRFDVLSIGGTADAQRSRPSNGDFGGGGGIFPNYGKSKGAPISGASMQDLEYYANGARRSLGDPSKARWHDKERVLLAAIDAEIERQGGQIRPEPEASADDDLPY